MFFHHTSIVPRSASVDYGMRQRYMGIPSHSLRTRTSGFAHCPSSYPTVITSAWIRKTRTKATRSRSSIKTLHPSGARRCPDCQSHGPSGTTARFCERVVGHLGAHHPAIMSQNASNHESRSDSIRVDRSHFVSAQRDCVPRATGLSRVSHKRTNHWHHNWSHRHFLCRTRKRGCRTPSLC